MYLINGLYFSLSLTDSYFLVLKHSWLWRMKVKTSDVVHVQVS